MSKTLVASALVMLLAVPAAAATPSQGEFPPLPKPCLLYTSPSPRD